MFEITTHTDRYKRVSESGLALCRVPKADDIGATDKWAALPHRELWAHLIATLADKGYPLVDSPELFVNPTGLDVVGGLKVKGDRDYHVLLPDGALVRGGYRQCIVFGNNNGGNGSLRLAAGAQVWICDNGCISGDHKVTRKHLVGMDWRETVDMFCSSLRDSFDAQRVRIQNMIDRPVTDEQAAHWLIERRRVARLPASVLDAAWRFWRDPPHREFEARNHWSLYNAVTEGAKFGSISSQVRALEIA